MERAKMTDRGFNALCAAIVEKAAEDYKTALKTLRKCRSKEAANMAWGEVISLRQFFRSDWYNGMCEVSGELVIATLEKRYPIPKTIVVRKAQAAQHDYSYLYKPVIAVDVVSKQETLYPSVKDAAEAVHGTHNYISGACNGRFKTAYGRMWRFADKGS